MQKKENIISVTITPEQVTCAWISKPTSHFPFLLHAAQTLLLNNTSAASIHLFNITQLKQSLTHFIASNNIKNPRIVIALRGEPLHESIQSATQQSELTSQHTGYLWESCPLFLFENGEQANYWCGVPTSIILQYQLLAVQVGHPLARITTDMYALIALYRAINGAAYRDSKLLEHFRVQNNNLHNLFNKETISRILKPSPHVSINLANHAPSLLTACGLTILENRHYARH